MRRMKKIGTVLLAGCLLLGTMLAGCKNENIQQKAEKETPLASLGEDIISLEEAVFYTRMLQEQ